jgi:glucose-1-phosphate thymidylyltransferase
MGSERSPTLVGLLPAAGKGSRLWPYRYPKELYPVALVPAPDGRGVHPHPVCQYALEAMHLAGAAQAVVVVSDEKFEMLRLLGDGAHLGLSLCYVHQREARGLPAAIACASPWLGTADVVMALPDTLVLPVDALKRVHEARRLQGRDLMLAVFPTLEPERLGPVEIGPDGAVDRIHDKPGHRQIMNTWGMLAWSHAFTEFCCAWDARLTEAGTAEGVLGHAMEAARAEGMAVGAVAFEDGAFADIGTPQGLADTVRLLVSRGMAFSGGTP